MLTKATAFMAAICLLITVTPLRADSRSIEVEALFENAAVLMINGQRKMLRVGQSFDGVTVVAADPASATLEFDGRTEEVGLSKRITSNFQVLEERRHTIARDANRQYLTNAIINGPAAATTASRATPRTFNVGSRLARAGTISREKN